MHTMEVCIYPLSGSDAEILVDYDLLYFYIYDYPSIYSVLPACWQPFRRLGIIISIVLGDRERRDYKSLSRLDREPPIEFYLTTVDK